MRVDLPVVKDTSAGNPEGLVPEPVAGIPALTATAVHSPGHEVRFADGTQLRLDPEHGEVGTQAMMT